MPGLSGRRVAGFKVVPGSGKGVPRWFGAA